MSNFFDDFFAPKPVFWKNHNWVAPVIDCFEPIFGFLMQFWFQNIGLTPGIPKGCFQHPQDIVYFALILIEMGQIQELSFKHLSLHLS